MSLHPVTVIKISAVLTASTILLTWNPSIFASMARIGSTSVTVTLAPRPLALMATPFPHHPYPATTRFLPLTIRLVAVIHPSNADCPVPYLLSNRNFILESFTAMTGNFNTLSFAIALRRMTPVVVSSLAPLMLSSTSFLPVCTMVIRSAPSSMM